MLIKNEYERYLASDHLEAHQKAASHYRIGQLYHKRKQWAKADQSYRQAISVNSYKPAKRALDRLKKMKKEGKINY